MAEIKYIKVKDGYELLEAHTYFSPRYNRSITCPKGMFSDGATGFIDLGTDNSVARLWNWFRKHIHHLSNKASPEWFFVHDQICVTGLWDTPYDCKCFDQPNHVWKVTNASYYMCGNCGTQAALGEYRIDNWTASTVAGDILWSEGWRFWSVPVWWATYLFGGGEARKNGMRRIKNAL